MPDECDGRRRALAFVRRLGCVVIGGALVAAALGALFGASTVALLGVIVAVEESLEFAVLAGALRLKRPPPARLPLGRAV